MSFMNHFPPRREDSEDSVRISKLSRAAVDSTRLATIGEQLFCLTYSGIVTIDTTTGAATPYAGESFEGYRDGPVATARFKDPAALVGVAGDVFVADEGNDCIRRISAGQVTTFAGAPRRLDAGFRAFGFGVDGPAATARFVGPMGIVAVGSVLYVLQADSDIRTVDIATGQVGTVAANFIDIPERPWGMRDLVAHGTDLYMCATGLQLILKLDTLTNNMTVFAGRINLQGTTDGPRGTATLDTPVRLTQIGNDLYCTARIVAPTIRKINIPTGDVSTLKYAAISGSGGNGGNSGNSRRTLSLIREMNDFVGLGNSLYAMSYMDVGDTYFLKMDLPSDRSPAIAAWVRAQYRNRHGAPATLATLETPSARRQKTRNNRKSRKTRNNRKSRNERRTH